MIHNQKLQQDLRHKEARQKAESQAGPVGLRVRSTPAKLSRSFIVLEIAPSRLNRFGGD
jgi:hypothetical protein